MKRILSCLLLALAGATTAQAQFVVPQGGLETWATRGQSLAPTGWLTTDDLAASAGLPFATGAVTRTASSHSGSYAANLSTSALSLSPAY